MPGRRPASVTRPRPSRDRGSELDEARDSGSLAASVLGEAQEMGGLVEASPKQGAWTTTQEQDNSSTEVHECEKQVRKIPGHFQYYVCYLAKSRSPSSTVSHPPPKASLGKPYPIAHYVTCNNLSNTHRCYLAYIKKLWSLDSFMR